MQHKKEFIIHFLYICIIGTIVYLFMKYLFVALLPFICAFLIIYGCKNIIDKLTFSRLSKKAASIIFTLLFVIIFSLIIFAICFGLFKELEKLILNISEENILAFTEKFYSLTDKYFGSFDKDGLFSRAAAYFFAKSDFTGVVQGLFSEFLPSLSNLLMKFISFFPSAIMFFSILFISLFYIGVDYDKISDFLLLQLPDKVRETYLEAKDTFLSTAKELFKAYFVLTFITFLQLLIGFMVIGIEYATILALIICFIDLLPILGTGTVLVPWAVVCIVLGDIPTAVGLISLYLVITIFRQIAEPKIVGANIGLSPLLSLISIFAGLKLMGIVGLIVFPIILMTAIRLNEKGLIRLYKNMPENENDKIKKTRHKFLQFKRHDKMR